MSKFVVHCKRSDYDVYIGRPSKFGNPYSIGKDGSRSQVIKKYKEYLLSNPKLLEDCKKELKGKVLGCWCKPYPCHGDILAEIANSEESD